MVMAPMGKSLRGDALAMRSVVSHGQAAGDK